MPVRASVLRFQAPPLRRRLRIALAGVPGAGKRTLFDAVTSTVPQCGTLAGGGGYRECAVRIGAEEASVVELPAIRSLKDPAAGELAAVDLVLQVADVTDLAPHLALALELRRLGRPMVLALNRMDEAWHRGMYPNARALERLLGAPVVPISALLGKGIAELFAAALDAARTRPAPPPPGVRVAACLEAAMRPGAPREVGVWRYWLDELMLHPRWGLIGSLAVFATVLFVVFWIGARLDALTAARLAEAVAAWQPQSAAGVIARAVADGLIGLVGILAPYMIPLVLLLVALEQVGI